MRTDKMALENPDWFSEVDVTVLLSDLDPCPLYLAGMPLVSIYLNADAKNFNWLEEFFRTFTSNPHRFFTLSLDKETLEVETNQGGKTHNLYKVSGLQNLKIEFLKALCSELGTDWS
jgi:hypothetical protein